MPSGPPLILFGSVYVLVCICMLLVVLVRCFSHDPDMIPAAKDHISGSNYLVYFIL